MPTKRVCELTMCHTCTAPIWVPITDFHLDEKGYAKNFCYPCAWARLGETGIPVVSGAELAAE